MQDHSHYRCNYGLYFRFWDRLCGTDAGIAAFPPLPGGHRVTETSAPGGSKIATQRVASRRVS
jgi:sterol desaturase/sphingolipid hydroxylase (fatty acid hydroxylase superfamily)|tara:strand:- start:60 stop:248 length:189 start_codon:yes stop_codon:yes gene_type:complete